jgi:hypothetical protein
MGNNEIKKIKQDNSLERVKSNLESLRLSQDYASSLNVKKTVLTIPVKKPHRQTFVQVHPDESHRMLTYILELKGDGENESYLVDRPLWDHLAGEIVPKYLFTAITRQGNVFLWPVRMPGNDGRQDAWSRSALEAAHAAMNGWIRVSSNRDIGSYEIFQPNGELPQPEWPDMTFSQILDIAFKDRLIEKMDHPIIKRLQGTSL